VEYAKIESLAKEGRLTDSLAGLLGLLAERRKKLELKRFIALLDLLLEACRSNGREDYVQLLLSLRGGLELSPRRPLSADLAKKIKEWVDSPGGVDDFAQALRQADERLGNSQGKHPDNWRHNDFFGFLPNPGGVSW
jgi:hypothetical protein